MYLPDYEIYPPTGHAKARGIATKVISRAGLPAGRTGHRSDSTVLPRPALRPVAARNHRFVSGAAGCKLVKKADHCSGFRLLRRSCLMSRLMVRLIGRRVVKRHRHFAPDVLATWLGPDFLDFIELSLQLKADFIHLPPHQRLPAQHQARVAAQMVQGARHARLPDPARRRLQAIDIPLFTPAQGAVHKDMPDMMCRLWRHGGRIRAVQSKASFQPAHDRRVGDLTQQAARPVQQEPPV